MDNSYTELETLVFDLKSRGLDDTDIEKLKEAAVICCASSTLDFFHQVMNAMQFKNISNEIIRFNLILNYKEN